VELPEALEAWSDDQMQQAAKPGRDIHCHI
jgi:hypothetical protein